MSFEESGSVTRTMRDRVGDFNCLLCEVPVSGTLVLVGMHLQNWIVDASIFVAGSPWPVAISSASSI